MTIKKHLPKGDLYHRCCLKDQYCYRNRREVKREVEWNTHRKGKETENSPSSEMKTVGGATQPKVAIILTRFPVWEILSASLCLAIRLLSIGLGGPVIDENNMPTRSFWYLQQLIETDRLPLQ